MLMTISGLLLPLGLLSSARGQTPLQVVPSVDLARYAGKWYEIARLPNRFQSKCESDVTAEYTLTASGEVRVLNRCRRLDGTFTEAEGRARRASEKAPTSKLKARFAPSFLSVLPFVWGDYQVIALAEDYSYSMVGTPDRRYLWILSRKPQLDQSVYARLLSEASAQGFQTARLQRTRQSGP